VEPRKEEEGGGGGGRKWREAEENCIMRSIFTNNYKGNRFKDGENEARKGEMRNVYRILIRKPWREGEIGRQWHTCEDNIRVVLRETDSVELSQDKGRWWALVNTVMNLRVS
jgi:hypothetical protein